MSFPLLADLTNFGLKSLALGAVLTCSAFAVGSGASTPPPAPYGTLPSKRQVEHSKLETYAFVHFNINTFTDREWGHGDEDPKLFNPTNFDPDQIVESLKAGGMKGVVLTCKHHDGFCLWPTATTTRSIAHSSWQDGKGDVVRAIQEACNRHGMKFGIYVSPWDRNSAAYGKPEYVDLYRHQLKELLTGYGPLFEVWHDGANGGDGYYGGANEARTIDKRHYYGWPETWEMIRKLQPDANIFSDIGPDLRWVGNESGFADPNSWSTYDPVGLKNDEAAPGYSDYQNSPVGTPHGNHWLPAECDVSIRPGWFWHATEDTKVKSPMELFQLYLKSVGYGASLILNVPPNREGKIAGADVSSLAKFGEILKGTFKHNLLDGAKVTASNVRGRDRKYAAAHLLSGDMKSYWGTDDGEKTPSVTLDMGHPKTFDLLRLREPIQLGQRIDSFAVDAWVDGSWAEVAHATTVGACRLILLDKPVTTSQVRLRVTGTAACPLLYGFGAYLAAPGAR